MSSIFKKILLILAGLLIVVLTVVFAVNKKPAETVSDIVSESSSETDSNETETDIPETVVELETLIKADDSTVEGAVGVGDFEEPAANEAYDQITYNQTEQLSEKVDETYPEPVTLESNTNSGSYSSSGWTSGGSGSHSDENPSYITVTIAGIEMEVPEDSPMTIEDYRELLPEEKDILRQKFRSAEQYNEFVLALLEEDNMKRADAAEENIIE